MRTGIVVVDHGNVVGDKVSRFPDFFLHSEHDGIITAGSDPRKSMLPGKQFFTARLPSAFSGIPQA